MLHARRQRACCSSAGHICIFVATEAGKPAYIDRLTSVLITWGATPLPADVSVRFVLSAHGLSQLFNLSSQTRRIASTRARAATLLAKAMPFPPHVPRLTAALRNEQLVVLDDSTRDLFKLGRDGAARRFEWVAHAVRERFADTCDWIAMTEDDTYVDVHAARWTVDCSLAPTRDRLHWYSGQVFGHTWGDFVHGDWMVFNRRSFVWTDNALWQCPLPRISWSDRFLGGCIRYAAGWPGYPEKRRHPGDYAGTPEMRPKQWPEPIIADKHRSVVVDLARQLHAVRQEKRHANSSLDEKKANAREDKMRRARLLDRHATSFHKLEPDEMVAVHALLQQRGLAQARRGRYPVCSESSRLLNVEDKRELRRWE